MIKDLKNKLKALFPADHPPDPNKIFIKDFEPKHIIDKFSKGLLWTELSSEFIKHEFNYNLFFSEVGFHYYFPAFMLYAFDHFHPDDEVCMYVVYSLYPGKENEKGIAWWKKRFQVFSNEQIEFLYEFLDFVCKHENFREYTEIIQRGKMRLQSYIGSGENDKRNQ